MPLANQTDYVLKKQKNISPNPIHKTHWGLTEMNAQGHKEK